jgi:uncharacterized surface protein with fasciclin (FAS1) repeats
VAPEAPAAIPAPAESKYKIPEVLAAYPGDVFSTLLAAVTAQDLGPALKGVPGGPPKFTVFAPTNAAFDAYMARGGRANAS